MSDEGAPAETPQETPEPREDAFNTELENMISENIESERAKEPAKNSKCCVYTAMIVFLSIILVFVFWPRWPPRSPFLPIPYVFNVKFRKALQKFASLPSHNQVMVVSGAKGVGKTRGLLEFVDMLNETGYLPIEIDFSRIARDATHEDVEFVLMSAVLRAFERYDRNGRVNVSELRRTAPFLELVPPANARLRNAHLNRVVSYLNKSMESDFEEFFFALEKFAEALKIVVICHEPLEFEPLLNFCKSLAANRLHLGVIFDVSSLLKDSARVVRDNPDVYRVFTVQEFDQFTARQIFVKQERVFRDKVFKMLWSKFNGNGEFYAMFHDLIREGLSASAAVDRIVQGLTVRINKALYVNGSHEEIKRRKYLLKLLTKGNEVAIDKYVAKAAQHLNEWGVAALTETNKLVLGNQLLITAAKNANW